MKKLLFILLAVSIFNCSDDDNDIFMPQDEQELVEEIDITQYNSELSIIENLDNGVAVLDITGAVGIEALYGLEYGGGFIYHVDETDGSMMVATDYSALGVTSWGDHFDLTNGALIGDGLENTEQIVAGNLNDNSTVPNGFEFGSDAYVFKMVTDLNYMDHDDWFVPSSASMKAIFDNVHSQGLGNFDEDLFYWTSTKEGYNPYVMSFNANFFGGNPFLGSCFNTNGVLIVRRF